MTSSFTQGVFYHRPFLHTIAQTLTAAILGLTAASASIFHIVNFNGSTCGWNTGYYGVLTIVALVLNAIAYFLGIVASFYTNERSKRFPAIAAASFTLIFISFVLQIATGAMDIVTFDEVSNCPTNGYHDRYHDGYYGDVKNYGVGFQCNWAAVGVELITFPFIFVLMFGGFKIAQGDEDVEASSSPQYDGIAMDERPFSPEKSL